MGGDLRIVSARPLPPTYRGMADARGLRTVESRAFLSMVAHREQTLLSEIQAVEAGYPLRGGNELDDGRAHVPQDIPARGTVWGEG